MQNNTAFFTPQELEQRVIALFVRRQFPFMPEDARSHIALVKPERTGLQRRADGWPSALPAQYSYTYVCSVGDCTHVIYILADAHGDILRVLMSK